MAAMISTEFIRSLRQIVGESHVSVSRTDAEIYSYDASLAKGSPDVVVFPADSAETARVVQAAHEAGVPFVPRGFGTNLSGGTVLSSGGLVVCLSRLNRILDIRPDSRYAVVQPGVTNLELQNALAPLGFFYAPDPASQKVATLGGNVGENSGGPRCVKYGVTTNHILGMEFVTPDGDMARIGGPGLDPPGYDLRGVIVGGEGTLGVLTEITVRILPLAKKIITLLVIYDDIADAARSVSDIISAGIVPATLEMMDKPIINAVEDSYTCGYPRDAAAVLIIEVEGPDKGLNTQAARIGDICKQNKCREVRRAKDDNERNRLWEGRRGAFGAVARLAPNYLVNDCTVPRTRLPEALAQVADIVQKYGFEHGNVFHAGDGNLHPLIFFDSRDPDQMKRVKKAGWEIMQACVALGGTISGEHGIGLEKMEAMGLIFSEADFETQRTLKAAFDPGNILNPGKVIPAPGTVESRPGHPGSSTATAQQAESEIKARIRTAAENHQALIPTGSASRSDFGNPVAPTGEPLSSEGFATVLEYDPPNQVITAGTGLSLEALQEALAENGQWLPVRVPLSAPGQTLGGIVALGACGPERMVHGAPRDMLLGLRYINGHGEDITAGGRVVKNVAGYDMTRLLAGSSGTLGFITQVTSRVAMIPERCAAATATGSLEACAGAARKISRSTVNPVLIAAAPDTNDAGGTWRLQVGFEGFSPTVSHQLEEFESMMESEGLTPREPIEYDVYAGPLAHQFEALTKFPYIVRADAALEELIPLAQEISRQNTPGAVVMDCGCGRIYCGLEALSNNDWSTLCRTVASHGGHILLEKSPPAFKDVNDVFGPFRPEWKLVHRIKAALDPQGIFSPGRLPGRV
jgi:glycolate dehydrogenase FAD-linked subunit